MSTEYRNFLALSYEELEELNLPAKADRTNRVADRRDSREAAEVSDRREADQGRHRAVSATSRAACTCSTTTRSFCSAPTRT